ncbi:DUF3289 family protein [Escherichia coli]|nr:DUF3289 family protein [Escherichia coli]
MGWSATIHFIAQDHFGLDVTDIKNKIYNKYRFFSHMVLFYNGIKTLLSNLFFSPILTLSKESKIIYEKQTPENYIMFISSMLHL